MYKIKKLVVFIWILLFIVMGIFALKVPSILQGDGFEFQGEFSKTKDILEKDFNNPKESLIVLFEDKNKKDPEKFKQYVFDAKRSLQNLKSVKDTTYPIFKNHQSYFTISLKGDNDINIEIKKLSSKLKSTKDFKISLTGQPIIEKEMNDSSQNDLKKAEMIGLPVAMIVLLLAFGGLIAAGIPLIIGVVSVVVTMGAVYFIGHYIKLSVFVLNVVPMIGLALSIDFALLYINRFREELKRSDIEKAIKTTTNTAGRSIAFSGLCVILGLSGMLFINIDIFKSVAIGGISVVAIAVISALTFLPSLLSWMGNGINKLMILKQKGEDVSKWRKFAMFIMKHPVIMSVLTIVLLSIAITPIRNIVLEIPDVNSLPEKSEVRISYEKFEKTFLNENETIVPVVLYTKKTVIEEDSLKLIEQTVDKIKNKKNVKDVQYLFSVGKFDSDSFNKLYKNPIFQKRLQPLVKQFTSGNKALVYVTIDGAASSTKAKEWVKHLQEEKLPLKHSVGGYAKFNQEIFDEIYQKAPKGLLMILITTYIILLFAFRSIVIPLKAIVMNMFSLGAAFGIVVWIFQGGNLGVTESNIALMIPIMVFAIVFGLSMDYEVFLISRIQEEYKKTNNNNLATLDGLTTTSKIITSAAAIMIVVTGAFSFTDILPVKQVGIAVAFSIFIDATIIRMILVPSLMKLLGDWNWWMPFRKK